MLRTATWVAMKSCLQRNNWCSVTRHYFAFTLQETSKIIVSATVIAAAGSKSFPCHFTPSETGRKAHVANIARESCVKLVVAVGNLINAPMPLFALTCQTFSWYHYKSHRNEWSDHLGTTGSYAACPHISAWGVPAAFPQATTLNNSSPPG